MTETRAIPKVIIDTIEPEAEKTGGTIKLQGQHMGGATSVKFTDRDQNERTVVPTVVNNEQLTVAVPTGLVPGQVNVIVQNSAGWSNQPYVFVVLKP